MTGLSEMAPWAMVAIAAMGQVVQIALTHASVKDLKDWRKEEVDPFMSASLKWRGRIDEKVRNLSPHRGLEYDDDESRSG